MEIPLEETIVFAAQAVEQQNAFRSTGHTLLFSRSAIILAPFDQEMLRQLRASRAADARARGASRFQQMWAAAQAPFALIDRYPGMTVRQVMEELPASRVFGAEDITSASLAEGVRSRSVWNAQAGEPPHRLSLATTGEEIRLQVDGHADVRELRRLLTAVLGDRLQAE